VCYTRCARELCWTLLWMRDRFCDATRSMLTPRSAFSFRLLVRLSSYTAGVPSSFSSGLRCFSTAVTRSELQAAVGESRWSVVAGILLPRDYRPYWCGQVDTFSM